MTQKLATRVLITYFSSSGNTKKMAYAISEGATKEGVETVVKDIQDVKADELLRYEGIIIGSPTYYGTAAYQIKKLIDESVRLHGELDGKVGAAFTSSANIGGGNETTILSIVQAMLIHGMIIQGDANGDHYGAVAIDQPDARAIKQCRRLGERTAQLVKKLFLTGTKQ
ncbi:MAG: flavodoxin domain-containing protein [Candidatus Omnitrophota bacterium]